jgi:hypothetical protein
MRKQQVAALIVTALVLVAVGTTLYRIFMPTPDCGLGDRGISSAAVRERWNVDPVPVLDLTSENEAGELLFTTPMGATLLANGNLIVGDEYDDNLKLIDSDGRLIRQIGRSGAGPFEFRDVSELRRCTGDSVFVFDRHKDQVTVLTPEGRMSRSFSLTGTARTWSAMTFDCDADGTVASMRWPLENAQMMMDGSPGAMLRSLMYVLTADGEITDSIADLPVYESRPFGKVTHTAVGNGIVAVATGDSSAIDYYGTDGEHLRTVLVRGPMREPTESQYHAHIEQLVAPFPIAEDREVWRERLRSVPLPPQAPPYSGLLADEAGLFWVTLTLPGDSLTLLRVVDREGILLADVRFDFDLRVYEIGSNYILGRYDDSEGRPHVAMFALGRPYLVR